MSLLEACTAVLTAGGAVSFPYRLDAEAWAVKVKAFRLSDGTFAVRDPYAGHERFASAELAAARLLELLRKMPPECLFPRGPEVEELMAGRLLKEERRARRGP